MEQTLAYGAVFNRPRDEGILSRRLHQKQQLRLPAVSFAAVKLLMQRDAFALGRAPKIQHGKERERGLR